MAEETEPAPEDSGPGETDDQPGAATDDLDYWKSYARRNERQAKANAEAAKKLEVAEQRLRELEFASKSETEKEIEKVRIEAAEEARKDALQKANLRIRKSEARAAAAGKLADPEDAIRFLDLDVFDVSDDGEIDPKALGHAIDRLLKDKPYLGADAGKRKYGDGDGGARRTSSATSMNDLIRQRAGRA